MYVLLAAPSGGLRVAVVFIIGLVVAGALIWAVRTGMRVMDREPDRPRADEQPHLPATGAVREEREMREPDEIPLSEAGSPRLMPYELHHSGSRRGEDQNRRRWLPGSSGSFGSGGPGRV
ncbi:Secreted protein OS=Streptomyces tendae OX=1932 GN=GUR47_20490 PE=4 SV=1 [Streptomyces tendae]